MVLELDTGNKPKHWIVRRKSDNYYLRWSPPKPFWSWHPRFAAIFVDEQEANDTIKLLGIDPATVVVERR